MYFLRYGLHKGAAWIGVRCNILQFPAYFHVEVAMLLVALLALSLFMTMFLEHRMRDNNVCMIIVDCQVVVVSAVWV